MERIGITASKIAKGNIFLYNFCVIGISFLFSLLVFFIAGSSIMVALIIIGYVIDGVLPTSFAGGWGKIIFVSMISLTVVVSIFTLFAILKNIKIKKE